VRHRTRWRKRRLGPSGQIEALIAHFARQSPGFFDDLLLVDSTPVECARSRETVKRGGASSLAEAKDILTLERHGARTLRNLRVRLCARFAALAAAVALNHQLGRPSRSLACYTT
jgi:hypothetical protein